MSRIRSVLSAALVAALVASLSLVVAVLPGEAASADPVVTPDSGPSDGGTVVTIPLPQVALGSRFLAAGSFGFGLGTSGQVWRVPLSTSGAATYLSSSSNVIVTLDDAADRYAVGRAANGTVWQFTSTASFGTQVTAPISTLVRTSGQSGGRVYGIATDGRMWANEVSGTVRYAAGGATGKQFIDLVLASNLALGLASDGTLWRWDGSTTAPTQLTGISGVTAIHSGFSFFFIEASGTTTIVNANTMATRATMATGKTWADFDATELVAVGLDTTGRVWRYQVTSGVTTTQTELTAFSGSTAVEVSGTVAYGIGADQHLWRDSGTFSGSGATGTYTSLDANGSTSAGNTFGIAATATGGTLWGASVSTVNQVTSSAVITAVSARFDGVTSSPGSYNATTQTATVTTPANSRIEGGAVDVVVTSTITGGLLGPTLTIPAGFTYDGQPLDPIGLFVTGSGPAPGGWDFEISGAEPGATVTATDQVGAIYTTVLDSAGDGVLHIGWDAVRPLTAVQSLADGRRASDPSQSTMNPPSPWTVPLSIHPNSIDSPGVGGWTVRVDGWEGTDWLITDGAGASWTATNVTQGTIDIALPSSAVGLLTIRSTRGTWTKTFPYVEELLFDPAIVSSVTGPNAQGRFTLSGTGAPGSEIYVRAANSVTPRLIATVQTNGTWLGSTQPTETGPLTLWQVRPVNSSVDRLVAGQWSAPQSVALPTTDSLGVAAAVNTSGLQSPPRAGDPLTYTFTASNTGSSALTGVSITPTLPGISALTYAWPGMAGSLAAGQSVTATATYALTQADVDAGVVAGSVSATSSAVSATPQSFSTSLARVPGLTTTASVDASGLSSPPQSGDVLTYTVTMTNTGNVTLSSVAAAATPAGVGPFTYAWPGTAGVLAPGQSVTATAPYAITAGDVSGGSFAATFAGSGQPPVGAPVTSAASTVTTDLAIDPPAISTVTGPDATGWDVTGTGEPGATVTITPTTGTPITALVQPDGSWSAAVPLSASGPISAVQALGVLVSSPVSAALPGLAAPTVDPVGIPDASGWDVEGTGVPGATVTVTPATGSPVTTTVQPDGTWSAAVPLTATGPVAVTQAFGPVVSAPVSATLPAIPPTPEPTVDSVDGPDGSGWDVEGTGEPGATITVTDQNGADVTVTVQPDGTWSAALPLTTEGPVEVTQTVGASTADPVSASLPGLAAPVIDTVSVPDASGWDVEGTGVPGATLTVTPTTGAPVTATVQPDGTWSAAVPPTATGPISATQAFAPVVSGPDSAPLPGLPAPAVDPVGVPDASGWDVTGTGVPGATIQVTDDNGVPVSTTVQPDGTWVVALPLTAVGPVDVTQAVGALTSAPVSATLPAIPPTPEPTVDSVAGPDGSGWDVEGTGEPGATITVTDQNGVPVTTTVQPDGTWSAALPLTTEGPVEVTQTVGASTSDPVPAALPGLPAPVIDTVSVPDASGWDVEGTGVPGATLAVTPATGSPVTATVQPDGSWAVAMPLTATGPIVATQAFAPVVSGPDSAPLPGLPAPTVDPVGTPDASGWDVEGTGVPGATLTVTPTTGAPVTTTVQPDGTWAAAVPLTATGPVAVTQAFGPVVSAPVSATLPAIPPTPEPTVDSVDGPDGSGWDVEGTGEPGATITITDQNGVPVATTVQPDGTWSAALPLTTEGPVEVTQTVGASMSDPVSAALPELGSPAVTAVLGPDAAGWDVYGTGVPGATITVTPATGAPASTTVLPDGTWVVPVPLTATGPVAAVQSFGPVVSDPMPATLPALAAPVIDTVSVPDASGWDVEGTGVPGATLTVTPATGAPVTTTVQPDGSWAVAVPLTATGPVAATQAFAPVVSSADFATLPGLSAPTVDPVSAPDASGWDVEGTGVPGATVTVTPASGSPVTATVQPDGTWAAAVPLTAVGPVQVTQAVGPLASAPVSATLPPPAPAPEPTVDSVTGPDASGWDIEGTGEPGATITITDQDGTPVTTTVQPDGSWSAPLPLSTEGPVDVTQTVGASTSDPVPATLPELDPPTVDPIAVPDASGWDIEGTGEPGATVTITPASGTSVTATVQPDGSWSAQLPPTAEGPIDVVQAFGAVASDPVTVPLPAAPDPVTVTTVLGPDAAGAWLVGGAGEDGATVTVTDDTGATVTVPVTGGTWSAVLPTGTQGPLSVTQTVGPVTSAPLVVALPVSELTVGASVDSSGLSATPQPGEPLAYQFTLGNPGDTVLSGVALASSIPGLALSYSWPGAAGVLAPGQTATATATYALTQADIDARTVASTVTASGQNPAGGPVTATPATTSTPIVAVASLTVSATSDVSGLSTPPHVGELVGFTFEVVNTGSTTLSSVQLASTLPGISALSYTWPGAAGVLAPGEHATVTATYPLGMADVSGFAIAAPHDVTATGLAPDSATVTSPTVTVETGLGAPPEPAVLVLYGPDESGAWTIGGEGMDGAVIVITDGNGTVTTTPVVDGEWSTTLPPGTVAPLTIIQRLGSVPSTDVEVSVLPTTAGDLEVAIDDDGLSPVPAVGDELELTFVVTNSGLVPLTGVAVSTTVPGLGAVTLTGWPGAPGSLAPGESVTATVDYVLTQDDLDAGRVSGLASLSGAGPAGNPVVTPTAPILQTLTSTAAAAMTVEGRIEGVLAPVAPGVTVSAGSDVHWTVTVTNTGPVTLHDVGGDTDAPQSASAALHSASAAALTAPQGFSGTLAPGASVVLSGTAPAAVGTHGIVASVSARVGTVQVAGVPVTLAGQASMFYTAAAPVTPQPGGSSGPGGLAWTGLQVSALVAVALGLAVLGTSAVLVGAARRRTRR